MGGVMVLGGFSRWTSEWLASAGVGDPPRESKGSVGTCDVPDHAAAGDCPIHSCLRDSEGQMDKLTDTLRAVGGRTEAAARF